MALNEKGVFEGEVPIRRQSERDLNPEWLIFWRQRAMYGITDTPAGLPFGNGAAFVQSYLREKGAITRMRRRVAGEKALARR